MKRTVLSIVGIALAGSLSLGAATIDAIAAFKGKCMLCHTTKSVTPAQKEKLLGPPADEVMYHVKEKYPIKEDAVKFITDYMMEPKVEKALCASMDKFGLMPSMKASVTPDEARAIAEMMFDKFPRPDFAMKEKKSQAGVTFETLDSNGDGFVSPQEFRSFRAKRNGIDPKKFKANLYFQKIDTDGDGKMSPQEFEAMRKARMQTK